MITQDQAPVTPELSSHFTRSLAARLQPSTTAGPKAKTITGYAVVYNSPSVDLGGYTEIIQKGAFDADLATGKNIVALFEHDNNNILGQTNDRSLVLSPDDKGIAFELTLPDSPFGQSVYDRVKAGNLDGMSFGFRSQKINWDLIATPPVKTVVQGTISEVTITSSPAYEMTVALTRSKLAKSKEEILLNRIDNNVHRLNMI